MWTQNNASFFCVNKKARIYSSVNFPYNSNNDVKFVITCITKPVLQLNCLLSQKVYFQWFFFKKNFEKAFYKVTKKNLFEFWFPNIFIIWIGHVLKDNRVYDSPHQCNAIVKKGYAVTWINPDLVGYQKWYTRT